MKKFAKSVLLLSVGAGCAALVIIKADESERKRLFEEITAYRTAR